MKNLIKGIFVFGIFVFQSSIVSATGYNYLPADVLLKQQEEKSALEYRLQNLEAGISGNSLSYVLSLSSRISQLEAERTAEKNYISGTYGRYGIGNQLPAKLAEIDSKYDAQISVLQAQKASYQSTSLSQQSTEKEISDLKLQIAQLRLQIVDQELQANLDALKKYETVAEPQPVYYSEEDLQKLYVYLDSLSPQDASDFYQKVRAKNADVASRLDVLQNQKYPNGKAGTAKYEEYLKSIRKTVEPEVVKPEVVKNEKITAKNIKLVTKEGVTKTKTMATSTEEKTAPQIKQEQLKAQSEQIQEQKPIQEKHTIRERLSGFFKRIFRIN